MNRPYFLKTERTGFSEWTENDIDLATLLWGNPAVTKYICAAGRFTDQEIRDRLAKEIENKNRYHVQYWPIFSLETGEFIGCCGLRPYEAELPAFELGAHLRPEFWGRGIATEAAHAAIRYAFDHLAAKNLFAGHHPNNIGSKNLLTKLEFQYIGDHFYAPTQLYHPSYVYR